jgi:hypothetical protein
MRNVSILANIAPEQSQYWRAGKFSPNRVPVRLPHTILLEMIRRS